MCRLTNILVLSLIGLVGVSVGQVEQDGQCNPDIQLQGNFNIDGFLGTWYENFRTDHPQGGDCSTIEFTRVDDVITVHHKTVRANFYEEYYGTATLESGTAKISLNMPQLSSTAIDFWVMLTLQDSFALIYRCENVGTTHRRINIWQLGRQTPFPTEMIKALMNTAMIERANITVDDLVELDHSEQACYVLPSIAPGEPVILPGLCSENITAVANFDAARFLGVWHQVASYKSDNVIGTCSRAQYSSGDGVVLVANTQIINRSLFTIEGYATVASNDSSGVLKVVLEVAPNVTAETDLYIIATDYDQWAISYSCENLANNQRRVYSWIISRQRELPAPAQTAVNAAVNSFIDLNYAYYQDTDQTNSGCFYIPDPVLTSPTVFGGQCDLNIPVQENFNANMYAGLWHNIELYFSRFQSGSCINAQYTLADGGLTVQNSQVISENLRSTTGFARFTETDGKLIFSFPGTANSRMRDYWVLGTDYNNWALVYSCTNINTYQMQINLWKLSRTRTLTPAANTAINSIMATQDIFDDRFLNPVDQSRDACFYYPEPVAGQHVVFPGQCADDNIPVINNFNLNQFSGQWYEIAAYPKEPLPRECSEYQFDIDGNTGLNFTYTSITDQLLDVSNGQLTFLNGTEARFNLTQTSGSDIVSYRYYIIATDYVDYALAYSCVDINEYYKEVFSWKLGRTSVLTAAANIAINNAMANISTVSNDYFEEVDHSDTGCFYFPDLAPGEAVILPGQCESNIPVQSNFNATAFLGRWRMIESYPSDRQIGDCNQAVYTLADDGSILVYNNEVADQILREINGVATLAETAGNDTLGRLIVTFLNSNTAFELLILGTDYENYALLYSCENIGTQQRRVWSWKMSRTTSLAEESRLAINVIMSNVTVLNDRYYQNVNQTDDACFYYPELNPSSTTRFRGQCDESIPTVTNFNPVAFMGLWHDISRYPAPFQFGTCGNAFYTLVDGTVDVFNTQVVNETLDTINGFAVLDQSGPTDTSAKLLVTFPVGGFNLTTPYWVLATDYNSYALIYSCTNIGDEHRSVSSWKMSREKILSTSGNLAMNEIISTIDVLDDRYYLDQDQTEIGCFYYPEAQPGVPVVFPGVCDDNVTVVQNFNMSRFQGLWHEIEAYPKDNQPGQCISHEFSINSDNTFSFQSFNVLAESLGITSGSVRFTSVDNSARLELAFVSGGMTITIPYWIVDTDYDNYALVYSCVNQPNVDFRGVWSWKLSRTKTLDPVSTVSINDAMEDNVVLNNIYYEIISQTAASCFYYPVLGPEEPVIFPGQCEPVTGVQNFNATRYLGKWRLIESYYTPFQHGTCNEANYGLDSTGTITVYNTHVVDQNLNSISGTAVLDPNESGALLVTLPSSSTPSTLWVLDTDYDTYSLVYSCENIGTDQRRVISWKLSRTNTLSEDAVRAINGTVNSINVLDERYYNEVNRTPEACFYFPEPDGSPVRFRARCDDTIPVVTNFNIDRYMGVWHRVGSYPSRFQSGTCGGATYSRDQSSGEITLINREVRAEALYLRNGLAVTANNSDAKWLVSFTVGGDTNDYWILDTDYDNYALVYSCQVVDEDYIQVNSWKLGRSKSLNAASNNAIEAIIRNVDVLDDRYYLDQNLTPEGCFYYPEPQPGVPVVFPGVCDDNVTVVQNFSMSRFQGLWHEIEAYPKDNQPGQCISHEFSVNSDNTFSFQSFNVLAESLGITSGSVRFTSVDNSARLELAFVSGGMTITIPYWIVDTDYDNYALVYSCVNQPNVDFRGVWSWKLSRSKTLDAISTVSINGAMEDNVVLNNIYYEPISQTDASCFYYPVLGPEEPVIFPGQCEPVTGVQNFNATRYLGKWRLIESYYTPFQHGTCNEANYGLDSNGTITVYNTHVVDQNLNSISGTAVLDPNESGALVVTLPSSSTPSTLWVLDTDYDTYSLVYSCENIGTDQRRVISWKLSRTNTLSEDAARAINGTINSINVLDERYYNEVNRTAEACFYFPEPNGNPVRFRARCDDTIPVVTNFNIDRYLGKWYRIESYPSRFQNGKCGAATYSRDQITGEITLLNQEVRAQELHVRNGSAVTANDSDAKWIVSFAAGGATTDYWVLATDYDNYALVYSCQEEDEDYVQVNSWKLSKTWELSTLHQNQITNIVNQYDVLDERYFEDIPGHSEEDCFYYPELYEGIVLLNGQCVPDDQVQAVTSFNANLFSGTWHEAARFPSSLQVGECGAVELSFGIQNTVTITQTEVNQEFQNSNVIPGTFNNDGRGVINTQIAGIPLNTFYVLGTDYNEYALVYGCRDTNSTHKQIFSWKLSRSRSGLSASANNIIDGIVTTNIDLFERYYSNTDQSNDACFNYPDFGAELPSTIELPGPCDESIRGVANFNLPAYLGRWIEIERYPQRFQSGICNRAEYSVGENNVIVRNTQVINEALAVRMGSATLASTDGTGLLNVTFVLDGVNVFANYYVVATDYNTFALVYSCRNIDNGNREVSSWKFSRTTTLSAAANNVINAMISQTQGLNQTYYLPTGQSEEDCFYVPEVNVNAAPLFRGQCDENIEGVPGFNSELFAGWWHEVERYPVDNNRGECISSQYQTLANNYNVVDTVVANGTAQIDTGTVVISANGRLRRTINGRVQDIWVLATDYDNYALLYSCENVDSEYRRIWSAKHSKARSLTTAAQNAMAPVIEANKLLYPQFYQQVDQSPGACFHYPELTGRQVILPGQCDENIPVVQSFDVEAYEGTWYQIERYPQIHEDGTSTCIGARYTLDKDTGIVTVLNWEVINGELMTIEGNATLSSSDGSAKLSVVLPVIGSPTNATVTTSLYVLTTNYESYSFAYSCSNINSFQRSIGAWKLSRERSMAPTDTVTINSYMANRDELHQPYFVQVSHDDECEEPSSGTWLRSSIIVMMICALWQILS